MSVKIVTCVDCGRVFAAPDAEICPQCAREQEEQFDRVKEYLKQNRAGGTVSQIAEALDLPERRVVRFLQEGRLTTEHVTGQYPCASCGEPISEGKYCQACREHLQATMERAAEGLRSQIRAGESNMPGGPQWQRASYRKPK